MKKSINKIAINKEKTINKSINETKKKKQK